MIELQKKNNVFKIHTVLRSHILQHQQEQNTHIASLISVQKQDFLMLNDFLWFSYFIF